ncbi:MAG: hypothetical protein KDD55_03485 [Bdellovibrionales bacterium]|nr:hypothetical protein [Bdellovibrionales bacterium]
MVGQHQPAPGRRGERIDLDVELLGIDSSSFPADAELPKHIRDLASRGTRLENNEIDGLLTIAGEDRNTLRACYVLMSGNLTFGFSFCQILNPNTIEESETPGIRRCLQSWQAVTDTKLFEDLWTAYIDSPEAFGDNPQLAGEVLTILQGIQKACPNIEFTTTSDPSRDNKLTVRDLPKLELILRHSNAIDRDVAYYLAQKDKRISTQALSAYYTSGKRHIAHPFCFTERVVSDVASGDGNEVTDISPSIPVNDPLGLVMKDGGYEVEDIKEPGVVSIDLMSVPKGMEGKTLRDIMEAQRDPLAFLRAKNKTDFRPKEEAALRTLEALALRGEPYAVSGSLELARDVLACPTDIQDLFLQVLEKVCRDSGDIEHLRGIAGVLSASPNAPKATQEVLQACNEFVGTKLVQATGVLDDLLQQGDDLAQYVDDFASGEITHLVREVFARRLQAHQAKFPEKPIEEVREAFLSPDGQYSEVADDVVLERAFLLYEKIHARGQEMVGTSRQTLREEIASLRSQVQEAGPSDDSLVEYMALTRELFRDEFGVYPYNTQLITSLLLIFADEFEAREQVKGVYAQVKTGEGKSLISALVAGYQGFLGRKVDVITSNSYLAARDTTSYGAFFADIGLSVFHHEYGAMNSAGDSQKSPDIIYSTNHDMIFSYLQTRLEGTSFYNGERFDVALVDEADNLCLDLGQESVRIATQVPLRFSIDILERFIAYVDGPGKRLIPGNLDEAVVECKQFCPQVSGESDKVVWIYLHSAWHSASMREGEDFLINQKRDGIILVDKDHTGRTRPRSQWQHGVHEFVTLRHGIEIKNTTGLQAQKNHPDFLNMYRRLMCISGTFGDQVDRDELRDVFGLTGFDTPPHLLSHRRDHHFEVYKDEAALLRRVDEIVDTRLNGDSRRPVLFLAKSVAQSRSIVRHLRSRGVRHQLMNGERTRDDLGAQVSEEGFVARCGLEGVVSISTNMAGRGTDIVLSEGAKEAGGLISVQLSFPVSRRVEIQGRGRAGRQGQAGDSLVIAEIRGDDFLKAFPVNLEHHLDGFGSRSEQLSQMLDFGRQASNLVEGQRRVLNYQREGVIQDVQEFFFTELQELRERLGRDNPHLRPVAGMEGVPDPLSLAIGQVWAPLFQGFDLDLKWRELTFAVTQRSYSIGYNEKPECEARLNNAFRRIYGVDIDDYPDELPYEQVLHAMVRHYRRRLILGEHEILFANPVALEAHAQNAKAQISRELESMYELFVGRGD